MLNKLLVDCRKEDLTKKALEYKAGIIGKSVKGLESLGNYAELKLSGKENALDKLSKLLEEKKDLKYVIVNPEEWKIITLENILAAAQNYLLKVITRVRTVEETKLATSILQRGVHAVIVDRESDMKGIYKFLTKPREKIELVDARIRYVKPIGDAERCCIDTVRVLNNMEGLLVGPSSRKLVFVDSESYSNPQIEKRPFRVNAGPVSDYVLVPGNKTKYLWELKTGDEVCIVDRDGNVRPGAVDRNKIETRPMLLVEAEYEGEIFGKIIQNAGTVRLVGDKSISTTEMLRKVDRGLKRMTEELFVKVYLGTDKMGRHCGMLADEYIEEK